MIGRLKAAQKGRDVLYLNEAPNSKVVMLKDPRAPLVQPANATTLYVKN